MPLKDKARDRKEEEKLEKGEKMKVHYLINLTAAA